VPLRRHGFCGKWFGRETDLSNSADATRGYLALARCRSTIGRAKSAARDPAAEREGEKVRPANGAMALPPVWSGFVHRDARGEAFTFHLTLGVLCGASCGN
jgi:hypothetical protein